MEFSWSTFVLELINFLVLVWILKRFLYKPVLDVISRRRSGIEETLKQAQSVRSEADTLQTRYEARIKDWDAERQAARQKLDDDLAAERKRRTDALQTELATERERVLAAEAQRRRDETKKLEEAALALGARFAGRLLEQGAGPETQAKLVDMTIAELSHLTPDRVAELNANHGETGVLTIEVASAYPMSEEQAKRLKDALSALVPDSATTFQVDADLTAGLRITVGAWVIGANVRDELAGFAEMARG